MDASAWSQIIFRTEMLQYGMSLHDIHKATIVGGSGISTEVYGVSPRVVTSFRLVLNDAGHIHRLFNMDCLVSNTRDAVALAIARWAVVFIWH